MAGRQGETMNSPYDVELYLLDKGYANTVAYDVARSAGIEDAIYSGQSDRLIKRKASTIANKIAKVS